MSERLEVMGHPYDVIFTKDIANRSGIYGIHLPKTLKIFVDGSVPATVTLETLWHEMHEATSYWNSLGMDHNMLSSFSANSMAVLLTNPWLVKLIYDYVFTRKLKLDIENIDEEDYEIFKKYGEKQMEDEKKVAQERSE